MKSRNYSLLIAPIIFLTLAIVACTINIGGPENPNQPIAISTEAVGELESAVSTAISSADNSGHVTIIITEPQLTSYLSATLQKQAEPLLTAPQVYLQDGQIRIYAVAQQGYFQANIELVITIGVDDQGKLMIELTNADFGPLPAPSGFKDAITAAIQEAFTGAIGPALVGFRLERITVADGKMTVIGQIK